MKYYYRSLSTKRISGGYSRWERSVKSPLPKKDTVSLNLNPWQNEFAHLRFASRATGEGQKCNLRPPFAWFERPLHEARLVREPIRYQFLQVGGNGVCPMCRNSIERNDAIR